MNSEEFILHNCFTTQKVGKWDTEPSSKIFTVQVHGGTEVCLIENYKEKKSFMQEWFPVK